MKRRYNNFSTDEINNMLLNVLEEYGTDANALTFVKAFREEMDEETREEEKHRDEH